MDQYTNDRAPAGPGEAVFSFNDTILWPLDRIRRSAWISHTPFAFWLIDALRPRQVVELGTHAGVSYCAFCQALKKLEVTTRSFAIDTWQGDSQAGYYDESVFADLQPYHDAQYGSFSKLLRMTFDEARSHFESASVDLLHIDGLHTYDAVRHDFETWIDTVSDRGVILFHDTEEHEGNFGVWKLWEELTAKYPSFSFLHGHGLGVLVVGENPPDAIRWLIAAGQEPSERDLVRQTFERLGQAFVQEAEIHRLHGQLESYADRIRAERRRADDERSRADDELKRTTNLAGEAEQHNASKEAQLLGLLRLFAEERVAVVVARAEAERAKQQIQTDIKCASELNDNAGRLPNGTSRSSTDRETELIGLLRLLSEERIAVVAARGEAEAAKQQAKAELLVAPDLNSELDDEANQLRAENNQIKTSKEIELVGLLRVLAEERVSVVIARAEAKAAKLVSSVATSVPASIVESTAAQPSAARTTLSKAETEAQIIQALQHMYPETVALGRLSKYGKPAAAPAPATLALPPTAGTIQMPETTIVSLLRLLYEDGRSQGSSRFRAPKSPISAVRALSLGKFPLVNRAQAPVVQVARRLKKMNLIERGLHFKRAPNKLELLQQKIKTRGQLMRDEKTVRTSGFFDSTFYLATYADVRSSGVDPVRQFCTTGWREGRQPSAVFNTKMYLRCYPDVAASGLNPLVHYLKHGQREGRAPDPKAKPTTSAAQNSGSRAAVPPAIAVPSSRSRPGSIAVVPAAHSPAPTTSKPSPNPRLETRHAAQALSRPDIRPISSPYGPQFNPDWAQRLSTLEKLSASGQVISAQIPEAVLASARAAVSLSVPKISVVMPTWNREVSICDAISSALAQSLPPYEIIVSDDGSTDMTAAIIETSFAAEIEEGRIKILRNPHLGVSAARNAGLEAATGDLIAYLDSDNKWRRDFLLVMASLFCESDELMTAYAALQSHDVDTGQNMVRATPYNRRQLLNSNFIDLNIFMHRRQLYKQFGGFDTNLKRLVDWELIVRYTKLYTPAFVPIIGVDYYLDNKRLKNITKTVALDDNKLKVYQRHFTERARLGLEPLRLAYVIYDFPALSQTFVINELRWLVEQRVDVKVYFVVDPDRSAVLDFKIESFRVRDADQLAKMLVQHDRNLCHSHFVYPAVTTLVWPACEKAGIHFTFIPHAVDLFHHNNRKRHRVGEIVASPNCLKVFVYGEHHKRYLEECGAPVEKISFNFQAVNLSDFEEAQDAGRKKTAAAGAELRPMRGLIIARFIEKKGISYLIEAAAKLKDRFAFKIDIYGYGPLEEEYRQAIAKHDLVGCIELRGAIDGRDALTRAYVDADFLVVPSVVAENGDMDGFPTVILEAMAARLPVLTTGVSAIPDYLSNGIEAIVVEPRNAELLADGLEQLLTMPPGRRNAMVARAENFLNQRIGVDQTMRIYLDCWQSKPVDIFLVTYNTPAYEDRHETFEIIRRIRAHTTTSYTLTIIDNGSAQDFWDALQVEVSGAENIRLIRKTENALCGPASNIALRMGDANYAIYICSKEGFVSHHGWERALIHYMDSHPDVAMGGHLCHLPRYVYGRELVTFPDFQNFRNQSFAEANPDRPFTHVQGGIFILRRDVFARTGGFNDGTPQNNMDVEYSYFLESLGEKIAKIPEVVSATTKTLPQPIAQLSERTVAAHPFTVDKAVHVLDPLSLDFAKRCNLCGHDGGFQRSASSLALTCESCHSTGLGRMLYALLASDYRAHRGQTLAALIDDIKLPAELSLRMFKIGCATKDPVEFKARLDLARGSLALVILDTRLMTTDSASQAGLWQSALSALAFDGVLLFTDRSFTDTVGPMTLDASESDELKRAASSAVSSFTLDYVDQPSSALGFDWCRIGRIRRATA